MSDIINDYFKRFYPPLPLDRDKLEFCSSGRYGGWRYHDDRYSRIFPKIVCVDGFSMSVQGHQGGYSYPADDFADEYKEFEVWELSEEEPLLIEWDAKKGYEWGPNRGESPYGYVPLDVVLAVIAKHGGMALAAQTNPLDALPPPPEGA